MAIGHEVNHDTTRWLEACFGVRSDKSTYGRIVGYAIGMMLDRRRSEWIVVGPG